VKSEKYEIWLTQEEIDDLKSLSRHLAEESVKTKDRYEWQLLESALWTINDVLEQIESQKLKEIVK